MSQSSDDKNFVEYLSRESQLSKQYRKLDAQEVPPELDRRILAQAHAAVSTAGARKRPAWVRWSAPLALAASMVLVISVVIESGTQHEVRMNDMPAMAPQSAPAQDMAPATSESPAKQEPATIQSKRRRIGAEREESQAASAAKAPQSRTLEKADARPVSDQPLIDADLEARMTVPVPTAQAPVGNPSEPALAMVTPGAPPTASTLYAPEAASSASIANTASSAQLEPQKETAAARDSNSVREVVVSADRIRYTGVTGPGAEPRGAVQPFASDEQRRESLEKQLHQAREKDPQAWLEYIRHLRLQNEGVQADAEWKRFHEAYPRYEVDEKDTARAKP